MEKPTVPRKRCEKRSILVVVLTLTCFVALGLGLGLGLPRPGERKTRKSTSRLGKFKSAAVSSDGVPCSDIGRDVLADGGSAVDSAIATLFCIGIVNPHSAGIGGGFLMTVYDKKSRTAVTLNARETAPRRATEDMFHGNAQLATRGGLSVAVPGEVAGYWAAHQRFGQLPWSRLILPSVFLAEKGTKVSKHMANALMVESEIIKNEPTMWDFVNPNTRDVLSAGDIVKRPELGKTLRLIAEFGADVIYNGTLAEKLVEDVQRKGGILTLDDLRNYEPVWSDPITVELSGNLTLYSSPPPGSGALLAYILKVIDDYGPSKFGGSKDPLTYHRIAEIYKHAYAQRTKLGDPAFVDVTNLLQNLTSKSYAAVTRTKIHDSTTFEDPFYYGAVTYQPDDSGTSHVSVLSPDGSAVSVTSTINIYFGAGFASPQTGIILNDQMDDFSAPNITNLKGVPPSPANFIRPGKRPLSSMCPTILVDSGSGKVRFIAGGEGGTKITTAVALTFIRNIWFGENIKEAIDGPRFHHQLFPTMFQFESGFPEEIIKEIEARGHETSSYEVGAVVTAISVERDGFVFANSDYRKGGEVAGF